MHGRIGWILAGLLCTGIAVVVTISASHRPQPPRQVAVPVTVLAHARSGDLIFRAGTESVSDAVRLLGQGSYSHVGMLVRAQGGWRVVNAVPAETPGRSNAVVIDDLEFFVAPKRARAVAIYQVTASPTERARAVAWARAQLGRPFGFGEDATYCTRLVWAAWQRGGVDLHVSFTTLHIPLLRKL